MKNCFIVFLVLLINISIINLFSEGFHSQVQITIFDNLGNKIKSIMVDNINSGLNVINIDNTGLTQGAYTYCINLDNSLIYQRLVIMR